MKKGEAVAVLHIHPELRRRLKIAAATHQKGMTEITEEALEKYLAELEPNQVRRINRRWDKIRKAKSK